MVGPMSGGPARTLALVILAAIASTCGPREDGAVVRTSLGDTTVVENGIPLIPDTATLEPVRTYGRASGSVEETFFRATTPVADPAGRVVVSDQDRGVKRFGADGDFLSWVAHTGPGPDEVDYVTGLAVGPEGSVAVWDFGEQRVELFRPEGGLIRSVPVGTGPRYGEDAIRFHEDGSLWIAFHPGFGPEGYVRFPRPVYVRIDESGAFTDTIFAPARFLEDCPALSRLDHSIGFWEDQREPWVPKIEWALGPDGTKAFGCPASYQFDVVRPDGSVLRISRPWEPIPTTDDEKAQLATYSHPPPTLPDTRPAYARIILPGDGRIWVWPNQPPELVPVPEEFAYATDRSHTYQIAERGAFDVFDRDGRWVGSVRLPEELHYSGFPTEPPVFIRGDTIWGVTVDQLDIEYVTRYRVVWPD